MVESTKIQAAYKETEVGKIPSDWDVISIGDIAIKVGSGKTPTGGESVYKDSGRHFVRSQNVGWGFLKLDDISFIDEATHSTFPNSEIKVSDVLLNITGASIGRCSLADSRIVFGNVNQHVCIIRLNSESTNASLIKSHLLSFSGQNQIDDFQTGGNRQGLNFSQIRQLIFPLPPTLAEQTAIAKALNDADALITQLEKLITKKRAIKQGTMQELLKPKEGWEVKTLGEIVDRIVGGGTPSRSNISYWGGEIPWVTVKDFATFDPFSAQEFITKEGLKNSASHLIPKGTLITSTRMAVGKAIIYEVDVSINQDLKAIFPKSSLNTSFLFYWFQANEEAISELGSGSTVMGISLGDLRSIIFHLPSLEKQTQITQVLSDMDAEIVLLEKKLAKYQRLKQGMMQNLLTGKIRLV